MIKLLLHNKTDDFFEYLRHEATDYLVVTPNPNFADLVRKRFDGLGSSAASITISKFMKDELAQLFSSDELDNYRGKSEILMLLGAIWKKLGADVNYIQFQKAFALLTEFRSFSMNESVLETILENYSEKTAQAVLWSHRLLENLEIIDEHKSYFMLAERLREGDLPPIYEKERKIVFYGFDYITASQLDLLKALSIRSEIIIPFYKDAFEKSQGTDWVKWLEDFQCHIEDISQKEKTEIEVPYTGFSKGYLGQTIRSYSKNHQFDHIVLGDKNISREAVQEIPFSNIRFKVAVDLFDGPYAELNAEYRNQLPFGGMAIDEFEKALKEKIKINTEKKEYRTLKTHLLLLSKIQQWKDLSDEHINLDNFDLDIILDSLKLDLPRINLTKLLTKAEIELHDLSGIESLKNSDIIFCLTSAHSGFSGVSGQYSENVEKYLASVGPIRRADFDLDIMRSKFYEFSASNKVRFFIEDGLVEEDSNLSKVFKSIHLKSQNRVELPPIKKEVYPLEIKKTDLSKLSASRIQSYKDCPRKYYLNYIAKLSPNIIIPSEVSPLELGRMEHAIIENYFKAYDEWSDEGYLKILQAELVSLSEHLPSEERQRVAIELQAYTQSSIINLLRIKKSLNLSYEFEKPFQTEIDGVIHSGSIDLFATNESSVIIIDFKRSARLFSSYETLLSYDQIQLWYYLRRLTQLGVVENKPISLGYMDLSDNENSRLIGNDTEVLQAIKVETNFKNLKEVKDWDEQLAEYNDHEADLLKKISSESQFKASPREANVCGFCPIKAICDRGADNGQS